MNNLTLPFSFTLPTKIVYGPGCIFNLIEELKVNNGKRPIIVTDKGIREAGLLDRITSILDNNKVKYIIYDGVEPNPKDVNAVSYTHLSLRYNR